MELQLKLDHVYLSYNDEDFAIATEKKLKSRYNAPLYHKDIQQCDDNLIVMNSSLRINETEGYYKTGFLEEEEYIRVPSLHLSVLYNQDELYSFVIQAEKIVMLRDMLDSYLKAYEMREKILAK